MLTFFFDDLLEYCGAGFSRCFRRGQENYARSISSKSGELESKLQTFLPQKIVRCLYQDSGAVTATGVTTGRSTVFEVEQDLECIAYDSMRTPAFYIGDEANTTSVVLEARVVETLFAWCIH